MIPAAAIRLRPDLVLVALAPRGARVRHSGLVTVTDPEGADTAGKVRQVGAAVTDVAPGQFVLFDRRVGQLVEVDGYPHLIVRVVDLDAVVDLKE